jgi:hypothetical protein
MRVTRRRVLGLALGGGFAAAGGRLRPPAAGFSASFPADFPVLDAGAVPGLDPAGRVAYRRFLAMGLPRAFAVSREGRFGAAGVEDVSPAAEAEPDGAPPAAEAALAACRAAGGTGCTLYAENLAVIAAGPAPPPPPGPLIGTWNYRFVPDPRFLWRGPARARGIYVWAHGTSTDPTGLQPPAHVRLFNNAGYDIVRFDREPNADEVSRASGWLRQGLVRCRAQGWRRVLAGGHSRGAWNCLQMLDTPGLADAVLAFSPAAHGTGGSLFMTAQTDEFRAIMQAVPRTPAALAFVQFAGDMFIGDPDARARLLRAAAPRMGGLLMIDRPAGFSGHTAARGMAFAAAFGPALLGFAA